MWEVGEGEMKIEINTLERKHLNILFETIKEYRLSFIKKITNERKDLDKWFIELETGETWLVVKLNSRIIGFVSFTGDPEVKEIQIFLRVKYTNQGLGTVILLLAEKWARKRWVNLKYIYADIDCDNVPSILLFRKMGYRQEYGGDYFKYSN